MTKQLQTFSSKFEYCRIYCALRKERDVEENGPLTFLPAPPISIQNIGNNLFDFECDSISVE